MTGAVDPIVTNLTVFVLAIFIAVQPMHATEGGTLLAAFGDRAVIAFFFGGLHDQDVRLVVAITAAVFNHVA